MNKGLEAVHRLADVCIERGAITGHVREGLADHGDERCDFALLVEMVSLDGRQGLTTRFATLVAELGDHRGVLRLGECSMTGLNAVSQRTVIGQVNGRDDIAQ